MLGSFGAYAIQLDLRASEAFECSERGEYRARLQARCCSGLVVNIRRKAKRQPNKTFRLSCQVSDSAFYRGHMVGVICLPWNRLAGGRIVPTCAAVRWTTIGIPLDWPAQARVWFFAVVVGTPHQWSARNTGHRFGAITVGRWRERLARKAGKEFWTIGVRTATRDRRTSGAPKRVPEGCLARFGSRSGRAQEQQESQGAEQSVHGTVSWICERVEAVVNRQRIKGVEAVRPRAVQQPRHSIARELRPADWR